MGDVNFIFKHKGVLEKLGGCEPTTELEAQAVLEDIRASSGYLDEETLQDLSKMRDSSRQSITRILDSFQETAAAYTKSVAEQLYSSKYRFLYELIQNADDSIYSNTTRSGTKPSLTFTITPTYFIIDTNEDGFTRANVKAICATGKSSKKTSELDDRIGEKGFGFKSVFAIANKVHIQSGVWSFFFKHTRGQDGLGMVTPLDAPPIALPENITTRITLTLADNGHTAHEKLAGAIEDLPNTVIFFLQRLENLTIQVEQSDRSIERTMIRKTRDSAQIVNLSREKHCSQGFSEEFSSMTERTDYYVVTHLIERMPEDERRAGRRTALVQLAFPVSADTQKPKLCVLGQHVFAYLPLQRLPQLNFLIQSDFIASASRESVVDCAWNDAIHDGVAEAFAKAVVGFAKKTHPLRHLWVDFVPNAPMERFWEQLYPKIRESLKDKPILQTWKGGIFKDLPDEKYLAHEYSQYSILRDFGVELPHWSQVLERLQADLNKPNSKLKSRATRNHWHESCSDLLLELLESAEGSHTNQKRQLKQMGILPLLGGGWTSPTSIGYGSYDQIYFPTTCGVPIPEDINLRLIETQAASIPRRAALFRKLGVQDCPKQTVIEKIKSHHKSYAKYISFSPHSFAPASHFRYLFHFDANPWLLRGWLLVPTGAGGLCQASKQLYFLSDEEYHTQKLLADGCEAQKEAHAAFVRKELVESESPKTYCQNLTWKDWLDNATGARYFPPLIEDLFASQLSPVMLTVLEQSREKFVGLLQAHWITEYKYTVSMHPWISSKLGECCVPCESNATEQLSSTYLPSYEIKMKAKELGVEKSFPILKLPVNLDTTNVRHWRFLEDFGVGHKPDLRFYKLVLEKMRSSDSVTAQNIALVYSSIASTARLEEKENLREFFRVNEAIYCPREGGVGIWRAPDRCVWQASKFLTVLEPLEIHYGNAPNLATFFSVFLEIRNAVIGDALDELDLLTESKTDDVSSRAIEIYRYLDATAESSADWELIRIKFEKGEFIFAVDEWFPTSLCLWASPFPIHKYAIIGRLYPYLERFFVKQLHVKTASASTLVIQLTKLAKTKHPRIEDMREILVKIGMMTARGGVDEKMPKALEELQKVKFLPSKVPGNMLGLAGIEDDFAIPDHPRFECAFREHPVLLDLSLDDSRILHTLFRRLGLVDRYLSTIVEEISDVGEGTVENHTLGEELRAKAYALYCCAAKFKSTKALCGDTNLFQQFSALKLYTADNLSTNLVLNLKSRQVIAKSDRMHLHSETLDGELKLYVPNDPAELKSCYRSQLPALLCKLLGISSLGAEHPISLIVGNDLDVLDDLMQEQDISHVSWITKPPRAVTPRRLEQGGILSTLSSSTGYLTPSTWQTASSIRASTPVTTERYRDLLAHVITHANEANHADDDTAWNLSEIRTALPANGESAQIFDRNETFGERDSNQMAHDRKIGAAGEAYVFEILSNLNLREFSRSNWQSTIRSEVQVHPNYHDLEEWTGRETADIVYNDSDGEFTRYLENNCFGGFPALQLGLFGGFQPIQYFIEVKTTTLACETRFFMSKGQYKRMKNLEIKTNERPTQIYLIMRVFNLTTPEIGMRIYVDPWRFRGTLLEFEAPTWTVTPAPYA